MDDGALDRLSKLFTAPAVNVTIMNPDPVALGKLPAHAARDFQALPLVLLPGNRLIVAVANPADELTIERLRHVSGAMIEAVVTCAEDLRGAVDRHYGPTDAA